MIGFYDSGIGGVTIYKKVKEAFPDSKMIYLADTEACPLGDKSERFIKKRVQKGVQFLFQKGASIVLLACNTATAIALRDMQQNLIPKKYPDKNILGVVRPVSEILKEISKDKKVEPVLVLATKATIESGYYQEDFQKHDINSVFGLPCSGLADAIEDQDNLAIDSVLEHCFLNYSSKIGQANSVILACTHYPIIKNKIRESLINKGGLKEDSLFLYQDNLTAQKLYEYLNKHPEYKVQNGEDEFFATLDAQDFQAKLKSIFEIEAEVDLISVK